MAYRETLVSLAEDTERRVLDVYRAYLAGHLTRAEAVDRIGLLVSVANRQGVMLADLAFSAEVMAQTGVAAPTVGVTPTDDLDRLTQAASTTLDVAETSAVSEAIVARLARCEPLESAAKGYSDAMIRSGKTKGWVRRKSANACQLCTWWWREGRIWPAEHPFQHHKGCTCTPKPVIAEGIKETWKTARAKGIR